MMLTLLPELLRGAAEYKDFLTGLLLLLLLIFLPKGVLGALAQRFGALPGASRKLSVTPGGSIDGLENVPQRAAAAGSGPLMRVENLGISFGGLRALQSVTLELAANEILGVIGPNGAGKTTLFNLISGMHAPDEGWIAFGGRNVTQMPAHLRTRLGMARTFQNLALFDAMSVIDNVRVGAHVRLESSLLAAALRTGSERTEDMRSREDAAKLLDFVGLLSYAEQPANSLAFGHQRLLEIARALASRPRLLLLDEPAAGLNSSELDQLVALIRRIRDQHGLSILLIGHTMRLVMTLSDRIVVLDHGVQLAEGPPLAIQNDARVIAAYLGSHDAA
jgi:ABC-type branched-subunit amino acid transport system ATPase component